MNWHILERATTQLGVLTVAGAGAVFASAEGWLDLAKDVPPQWWVVIWMAGVTIIMLRWMMKQGKHTPRAPSSEVVRNKQEIDRVRDNLEKMEARMDKACEQLAEVKAKVK